MSRPPLNMIFQNQPVRGDPHLVAPFAFYLMALYEFVSRLTRPRSALIGWLIGAAQSVPVHNAEGGLILVSLNVKTNSY